MNVLSEKENAALYHDAYMGASVIVSGCPSTRQVRIPGNTAKINEEYKIVVLVAKDDRKENDNNRYNNINSDTDNGYNRSQSDRSSDHDMAGYENWNLIAYRHQSKCL